MKLTTAISLLFFLSLGCKSPVQLKPQKPLEVQTLIGEEGETVVLGFMNRANLNTEEFNAWFQPTYDSQKIPNGWAEEHQVPKKSLKLRFFAKGRCSSAQPLGIF